MMSTLGVYVKESASLLMKPLYGARAVRPELCVPIQHLASEVTRWSAECDRKIHRMCQYIFGSQNEVLTGALKYESSTEYVL